MDKDLPFINFPRKIYKTTKHYSEIIGHTLKFVSSSKAATTIHQPNHRGRHIIIIISKNLTHNNYLLHQSFQSHVIQHWSLNHGDFYEFRRFFDADVKETRTLTWNCIWKLIHVWTPEATAQVIIPNEILCVFYLLST